MKKGERIILDYLSYLMSNKEKKFYNRKIDRKIIEEKILDTKDNKNIIIFLCAESGVGKSALIEHIELLHIFKYPFINLKFNSFTDNIVENGYFLKKLHQQIDLYCRDNSAAPFNDLQYSLLSFEKWKSNLKKVIQNIAYLSDVSFSNSKNEDILDMINYIKYVLNETQLIINIENFQCIDYDSLDAILSLTASCQKNIFIFQYTLNENNSDNLSKLMVNFQKDNNNVCRINLDMLDFDEAQKLLPKNQYSMSELYQIRKTYIKEKGNLYQIKTYNSQHNTSNYIKSTIKSLDTDKKYILYLVALSQDGINEKNLVYLLKNSNENEKIIKYGKYDLIINSLLQDELIEFSMGIYHVPDPIMKEIDGIIQDPILFTAYSKLLSFYKYCLKNNTDYEENFFRLFSLCTKFNDPIFLDYLPEFKKMFLNVKYPKRNIQSIKIYTNNLKEYLNDSFIYKEKIYSTLIEILIENNDPENAEFYLKQIYNPKINNHIIMYSKIYLLKATKESIQDIDDLLLNIVDKQTELIVSLSKLQLLMKLETYNVAYSYALSLYNNKEYSSYKAYGFAISNLAEFYDDAKIAINFYLDAIDHFKKFNCEEYEKLLYSNLSMSFGYLGKLEESLVYINKIPQNNRENTHLYYNNRAVIDILSNQVTEVTITYLENALYMSIYEYEQLIIHNNLLISYILLKDYDNIEKEYKHIINSNFEKYKNAEFLIMNYRNILFYSYFKKNNDEINLYIHKIQKLISSENINIGIKKIGNAVIKRKSDSEFYYSKLQFHPEFVCFWGVPLLLEK